MSTGTGEMMAYCAHARLLGKCDTCLRQRLSIAESECDQLKYERDELAKKYVDSTAIEGHLQKRVERLEERIKKALAAYPEEHGLYPGELRRALRAMRDALTET